MTDEGMPEETTEHPYEYGTYDPTDLQKQQQTEQVSPPEEPAVSGEPAFDERYKEPLVGLLYLGALTKTFEWVGHTIVVRTLSVDDELAIGQVIQPWNDTAAFDRAHITAVAAMAVVSIDGKEPPIPLGPEASPVGWAHARFNWLKANAYRPTIDKIFSEYITLENDAREAVEHLEKASGSSPASPSQTATGSSSTPDALDD